MVHEALIQISMSFLLFLQRPSHLVDSDSGINFTQIISSIFGYFCIVLIALYFLLVLKIATGKENELIRPQIRRKVGFIYSDLKP